MCRKQHLALVALAGLALVSPATFAVTEPDVTGAKTLVFQKEGLQVSALNLSASQVTDGNERARPASLGSPESLSHYDLRTGRFATLMPSVALLPGKGKGNTLTWSQVGLAEPTSTAALKEHAWAVFKAWLSENSAALRIDPRELVDPGHVTVLAPDYIQIYSPRRVNGLEVRGAHVTATIKYGNLILFGADNWGDVDVTRAAELSREQAVAALTDRTGSVGNLWKAAELAWLPVPSANVPHAGAFGNGLDHRLVWVVRASFGEERGRYEALIDAVDGEVLSIQDTVQYGTATTREVQGGVFPVSNDGINPDGVEQSDYPMSFSRVQVGATTFNTDMGGNLPLCVDGNITHDLTGPFLTMDDDCGAASLTGSGSLDWGTSSGTDCTTPGVGGPGNTHASRTGFHELNMIKAMGRSHLPNNGWLKDNMVAQMNLNDTCNAFWNGVNVGFYRSGGGCNNTGELAGVFDHEWGHGMDNNDGVPSVSSPGEGIADIYASLRIDDSCLGRNFRGTNCGGYGNPCTACSGVRDIDWAKHSANTPFTMTNADNCGPGNSNGPCGGSVHCEGQVYSQAVWDLWNRDLVAAPFNRTLDVAREVATQLTYRGASGVASWFSCTPGSGGCGNPAGCGCAATNGYQQFIAADDDNGNLADGTPHMGAIFTAFNRHGIHCTTPTNTTAGCSSSPTEVPVVTAEARDRGVALSWTASTGATGYRVYRTDGVFGCNFGKQLVATVNDTSYVDLGLQNGRSYYYQVVPMGAADECFRVASSCTTGTPAGGDNLALIETSSALTMLTGDSDPFLDNCETARISVPVTNIGTTAQTNVRVVNVQAISHPANVTILTTLPAAVTSSLVSCGDASAVIDFSASNLDPGETLTFRIEVTSDELGGETRFGHVSFSNLENDFQNFASKTFNFDTNTEGFTTQQGTFVRDSAGGGASATPFYMRSSTFLDNQCDVTRSPFIRLAANSTMDMFTNYDIEAFSGGQWWDRANVSVIPPSGNRTVLTPSGGRPYQASGTGGVCGLDFQGGWAGTNSTWAVSNFNAAALGSAGLAGQLIKLEMRYGTDAAANAFGFRFDQVTLTNVDVAIADAGTNACTLAPMFADGFESGSTSGWTADFP